MTTIETIEKVSNTLAKSTIRLEPKRCSYIRNWNSKCKHCLNACQHEAIQRSLGHFKIDAESCTDCGACVASCPTSMFATGAPTMNQLVKQARISARENDGTASFICAQHAEEMSADTTRIVVLPCLNYLDEYLIVGLFAVGVNKVSLIRGDCTECAIDCGEPYFDEVVRSARSMLEAWSIARKIETLEKPPQHLRLKKSKHAHVATIGSDRREAFKQGAGSFMGWVSRTVDEAVGKVVDEPVEKEDPDKQIIVKLDEVFPPETYRSVRMLNMLDHLGSRPYGATIESRFWASIDIDENRCRHCGMCAEMCVTRALKAGTAEDGTSWLAFRPSLCVNCGLCRDSCLTHSMVYTNRVLADDLDRDFVKYLYHGIDPKEDKKTKFF